MSRPFALFLLSLFCLLSHPVSADDWTDADTARLVAGMRNPPLADSWAIMEGQIEHKARGKKTIRLPISFRARFMPERSLGQLIFNEQERYLIGQSFADKAEGTSVIPQKEAVEGDTSLADVGIRPSDITLSFLYWDFVADRGEDRLKTQPCRIIELQHPGGQDKARVWVSIKHQFPLQVQWYTADSDKPYRELEISKLKKVNEVWIISQVKISNPGWKTAIKFKDIELYMANEDPIPDDLFLED